MDPAENYSIASFGEVLWDLLPGTSVLGGAPFNFTSRVNSLGNEGIIISAVGKDELGEKALETISGLGISGRFIQRKDSYPTGTVNVFFDEYKNPDYEIIRDVAYDHITCVEELLELSGKVDCISYGTLAQRNQESRQTLNRMLEGFTGRFRFYDINLRKGCYSPAVIDASLKYADILKLNKQEAIEINRLFRLEQDDLTGICAKLIENYRLRYCVVTLEEYGSLAFCSDGDKAYSPGFRVELADPLGSGDAYSAGFIHSLLQGRSLMEASEHGNRMGALVATKTGATAEIPAEEFERSLMNKERITDKEYL